MNDFQFPKKNCTLNRTTFLNDRHRVLYGKIDNHLD